MRCRWQAPGRWFLRRFDLMANPWTGEVTLVIDGQQRVLKLTLGALAELEQALEVGSLVELVQRFEGGVFSSRDVLALIVAGVRGGGGGGVDLANADIAGGPMAAARVAAELLARAFMLPGET
ncbi:MAG: hypothetical protein ACI92Z_002762 [Paracoccaceae bacterium]|jgi:hypothetical protein